MSFNLPVTVLSALSGMFGAKNRSQRRYFRKNWPTMIAGGSPGLSKKTGVVVKSDGGGGGTTQDIALGFSDGKFVILWSASETSEDSFHAEALGAYGFSDGTTHYCLAYVSRDAQATADTAGYTNSKALALLNTSKAVAAECTASFSGSNLRLTWSTGDSGSQLIHYFVLGGAFSAQVVTTLTAKTSTGSRDQTPLSFTPGFVHFITNQGTFGSVTNGGGGAWGFAASNGQRGAFDHTSEDNSAAGQSATYMVTTIGIAPVAFWVHYIKSGIPSVNGQMRVTNYITNGWTEQWDVAAGSAYSYGVLALVGLAYAIKYVDSATSTGDHAITGFGIASEAVLAFTSAHPPSEVGSGTADASLGIGAATSTSDEHACWNGDNDDADPTETDRRDTATYFMLHATPGTPTLTLEASMTSFDRDGITPNYNTAPGSALGLMIVAFAEVQFASAPQQQMHRRVREVVAY